MTVGTALLAVAGLLLLNGFFVLAEFALVKLRPTRVETLIEEDIGPARLVRHIQTHLDEYLSVCQLGITLASIGLGFVGEPAFAALLTPLLGSVAWAHGVSITLAYVIVSFLHILFGELIPKSLAIRAPERSALGVARLLQGSRVVLWLPLKLLNGSANLILRLIGFGAPARDPLHSEDEIRLILELSQSAGSMSFRQLLLMENVFDLRGLRVRDAMRPSGAVRVLRAGAPWEENFAVIRDSRFSRFPLVEHDGGKPIGMVHVKDLLLEAPEGPARVDLRRIARPTQVVREDATLESLLAELQRRHRHMAIVLDAADRWTGTITLEDVLEEIIGTIEDEFELEPPFFLADAVTPGRIVLGLEAATLEDAIREAIRRVPPGELPLPPGRIVDAVIERERGMPTLLASGLAAPHARLDIRDPVLIFARSDPGVTVPGRDERAHLLFVLLTPMRNPRAQLRLLARVAGLLDSEYVVDRLREAESAALVLEVIRAADPVALG
jgi:CBS domain containing-hemolysin-like protein